jgi:glycosyltransferase involved in cell wall biosynthesis
LSKILDLPGKGNALKVGFKTANYDILIMMDADYSHRPEDIPLFIEKNLEKCYFV